MNYKLRRQQLMSRLPPDAIAIIPGGSEVIRNGDAHYRFCQDSDFYYLTGFEEPEAILVVTSHGESVLFNRALSPAEEQWSGARLGQEGAIAMLGVDKAYPVESFDKILPELLLGRQAVYFPLTRFPIQEKILFTAWLKVKSGARKGVQTATAFMDIAPLMAEARVFKDVNEVSCMREAARISIAGHERIMKQCKHLKTEYQLEAEFIYEVMRQGCRGLAYDSIVASGDNACVLHYTANNRPLLSDKLVLIDAGGEYQHYAADITRTIPAGGRYSGEQRAIYELVLNAQRSAIAAIKPGLAWDKIQEMIVSILTAGLIDLNILQGSLDSLLEQQAYKAFYMHSSGHWLGLDVHDVGAYKEQGTWRLLRPGMVLTVEPGLYLSSLLKDSPWYGIGVRIEDDILVTEDGFENLTAALPVTVSEIEDFMRD